MARRGGLREAVHHSLGALTTPTGGRMTQKITINVDGDSVISVHFDKRLSDEEVAEFERLLMADARLVTIGHFIKLNWPESVIHIERGWGYRGQRIICGDGK